MADTKGHLLFDDADEIIKANNQASPVDLKPFQEQIDRIAGKTTDGKSRVRIVWGQDFERTKMIVCGKWRMRYPFYRYEVGSEIRDIGIPRFYIEELHLNAELQEDNRWEQARWTWEDGVLVDVLGPIPAEGFYSAVFMIAHHDEACCNGEGHKKFEQCLGGYRPPNDADLERIRRAIWNRDHAPKSELQPSDELIRKRNLDRIEQQDQDRSAKLREGLDDFARTHAHTWVNDDPTVAKWGKYHWVSGHNKSGTKKGKNGSSRNSTKKRS